MTQENDLEFHSLTLWQRIRTHVFLFLIGVYRHMTVGVRAVLLRGEGENQEVFLIKHTYLPGWQFPGGGVEPSETMHESMVREVEEETGLQVQNGARLPGVFLNASASNRDHVGVFICREPKRIAAFKPNLEIADGCWFPLNDLPKDITRGTQARLQELLEEIPIADRW